MRPDAEVMAHQLRIPREGDVPGVGLPQTGAHVRHRVVEVVFEHPPDVVLGRIHGEAVAVGEPVELVHLEQHGGKRHQLVQKAVGDDERKPPRIDEQPQGVALTRAVRARVQVARNGHVGQQLHPAGRRPGQHDRLGEHFRMASASR